MDDRTKQRQWRARVGICVDCGKPSRPGKSLCAKCAETKRVRYREVAESGFCVACKRTAPVAGRTRCAACADKQAEAGRRRRARRKREGLCVTCGVRLQVRERARGTRCNTCCNKGVLKRAERKKLGLCRKCGAGTDGRSKCGACRAVEERGRQRLKDEVFAAYGGYECACCGELIREFLTIDHVNGDGAAHRRRIGSAAIYRWLKREGFPAGYQVLCMNCNWAKGVFGACPHGRKDGYATS